jgi:hypothetical protein
LQPEYSEQSGAKGCQEWNSWCAVFCGFVWLEALENLGVVTVGNKNLRDVIKGSQARVKNQISGKPLVSINDGGSSLIDNFINIFGTSVVSRVPRVGSFFYRKSYVNAGNNHCGIVIKIEGDKFWTIEGNAAREDNSEGIACWEYSFNDIASSTHPMYFISFETLGKELDSIGQTHTVDYVTTAEKYTFTSRTYLYKPYFDKDCWQVPPKESPAPPPNKVGEIFECPAGMVIIDRLDPSYADSSKDNSWEAAICPEGYQLIGDKQYAADRMCVKCGTLSETPTVEPPTNDCPEGYARDVDGNCKENKKPPQSTCCPTTFKVTNNPMRMLPISVFQKNEVSGINADVLADIIGAEQLGLDTIRKKATHGMAMGLLNSGMDTGTSTGFGLFRGMRAHGGGHYNTYMVGYGMNKNFLSALCNGIGGPVDDATLVTAEGTKLEPHEMAEYLIGEAKDPNKVLNWLKYQPFMQNNGIYFRSSHSIQEAHHKIDVWKHFSMASDSEVNAIGYSTKHGQFTFVPFSHADKEHQDEFGNNFLNGDFAVFTELGEATKVAVCDSLSKCPNVGGAGLMMRKNEGGTGFISERYAGGKKVWNERGVAMTLPTLLNWLDIDKRDGLTVIVLLAAKKVDAPPLFSQDFWQVFDIACSVLSSIPIVGGAAGSLAKSAVEYLPIVKSGFELGANIEKVLKNGKSLSFDAAMDLLTPALQLGMLLAPKVIKDAEKSVSDLFGTKWSEIQNSAIFKSIASLEKRFSIGSRLEAVAGLNDLGFYGNNKTVADFLLEKVGINKADIKQYHNRLTGAINDGLSPNLLTPAAKIFDLDEASKYWDNIKSFVLSDAIGTYFEKGKEALWKWDLSKIAVGGDFTNLPTIREVFIKSANVAMTGSIPGIETIIGASLGAKHGEGHKFALQNYGSDALFGMVKTAIGLPTEPMELKNIIADSLLKDAGYEYGKTSNNPILLPSYMDAELRECIICKFEYDDVPVQHCDPGMTYNYLTGKCEKQMFSGITTITSAEESDCYTPCQDMIAYSGELPKEIVECQGSYYFDTQKCKQRVLDTVKDVLNPSTIASIAATIEAGLATTLMDGKTTTVSCLPVNDCISKNPALRNAIYTVRGWFIYTGDSGFRNYPSKRWLRVIDFSKCKFELEPCDCCNSLHISIDSSTQFLAKKLEELALLVQNQNEKQSPDLLTEIKKFRKQIENNKLYVGLQDGDYIDERTYEIDLLILELQQIITEMKYCEEEELTAEILELIDRIRTEMHNRTVNTDLLKDKFVLSSQNFDAQSYGYHLSDEAPLAVPVLPPDFYSNAIDDLHLAIEKARVALENCTCEDIQTPSGDVHYHYYNNESHPQAPPINSQSAAINKETVKEIVKEIIPNIAPPPAKDYSDEFAQLYKRLKEIETNLPNNIANKLKDDLQEINKKLIDETLNNFGDNFLNKIKNGELKLVCPANDCKDRTDEILEKIGQLKLVCNCNNKQPNSKPCEHSEVVPLIKALEKKIDSKETTLIPEMIIKELEKIIERTNSHFTNEIVEKFATVTEKLVEKFYDSFEKYTNNFEKVIEKTECSSCDNSELIQEIINLRKEFSSVMTDYLPLLANNEESHKQQISQLVAKIDGIKCGDLTKEVINELILLRQAINKQCTGKPSEAIEQQPIPNVPTVAATPIVAKPPCNTYCNNGECCDRPEIIERTITEKIRRN